MSKFDYLKVQADDLENEWIALRDYLLWECDVPQEKLQVMALAVESACNRMYSTSSYLYNRLGE